jgi:hypothetical protein
MLSVSSDRRGSQLGFGLVSDSIAATQSTKGQPLASELSDHEQTISRGRAFARFGVSEHLAEAPRGNGVTGRQVQVSFVLARPNRRRAHFRAPN